MKGSGYQTDESEKQVISRVSNYLRRCLHGKMISGMEMFLVLLFANIPLNAETIKVGFAGTTGFNEKSYNDEFVKYNPYAAYMAKNGIQIHLMDSSSYCGKNEPGSDGLMDQELESLFKQNHVVYLAFEIDSNIDLMWFKTRLMRNREIIKRYVQEGGGLVLQPISVRYGGMEKYYECWNAFLEPFGMEIMNEGLYDKTRSYEGKLVQGFAKPPLFWQTSNIVKHPVTEGVNHLFLPLNNGPYSYPGVCLVKYSHDWKILVKGEKEAQSYKSVLKGEWQMDIIQEGSCNSEPPVLATREFGKGRIVCYPLSDLNSYAQFGMKFWNHVVEINGDGKNASDSTKLWINAFRWCAEPVLNNKEFGSFVQEPYQKVSFPKSTPNWNQFKFGVIDGGVAGFEYPDKQRIEESAPTNGIRGLVGAHTALSDGQGSVADYVVAAKKANLSFIVFTESLEKLSPESFARLKTDCAAASKDGSFYACPGIEFSDANDCRWTIWGDTLKYPPASQEFSGKTYTQWDGKRIQKYGAYVEAWNFIPNGAGLIDFADFRKKGCHPEKMWWYFTVFPFVYEKDQLVIDQVNEYLGCLRDLRWDSVSSFTRVKSPAEVAPAAAACFTSYKDLASAIRILNSSGGQNYDSIHSRRFASQGPTIALWQAINAQMEYNWRYTRGAQRVRLQFIVRSDVGIREVKVHDSNWGLYRRFAGQGAKELVREFEAVNDRQHNLVLEVIDEKGQRAISQDVFIFSYKNGHYRCGDNLNILDSTGMPLHPDREQMLLSVPITGWMSDEMLLVDGGGSLYPVPNLVSNETISFKDIGTYPAYPKTQGKILDVRLPSYAMIIDRMHFGKLSNLNEGEAICGACPSRDVAENEYFTRTHTLYITNGNEDKYVMYNYRRKKEGVENYEGALYWHEGEIRFKKDAVLQGSVPIPLVSVEGVFDKVGEFGGTLAAMDRDKGAITVVGTDASKPATHQGYLSPGGYLAILPYGKLHVAFYASNQKDFTYSATMPNGLIQIGLGTDGQVVKAGEVFKYRYATAVLFDKTGGNILQNGRLAQPGKVLNLSGDKDGYPIKMKIGELADSVFFLTAKAKDWEVVFTAGPKKLLEELPIRVEGLKDNGCVAVYSSVRPWFRFVPVYEDTAWFQESIDTANTIWVGNVFMCEDPAVKLTLVVDGQAEGQKPFIEVHNPTDQAVKAKIVSPPNTPVFGGISGMVEVPAGCSTRLTIDGKSLVVQ